MTRPLEYRNDRGYRADRKKARIMAKPYVKIRFANGALGSVPASADGVVGMVVNGVAVAGKLELGKPYVLRDIDGLAALGVTGAATDANKYLYQCVELFYAEAGKGAELWVMVVASATLPSAMLDPNNDNAKKLIRASKGRVRTVVALTSATATVAEDAALGSDVATAITKGQALGEWAADTLYAPVLVLIEGKGYTDAAAVALPDLTEGTDNRVGVVIGQVMDGDTAVGSLAAVIAGRIAKIPVQRHIGRVRDGALKIESATIDGTVEIADADIDTVNDKGYITLTTHVGRSGYYVCDDHLATAVSDDYHSLARRRVVDKAYRIAHNTLLNYLNDEVACNGDGTIVAAVAKSWEADVVADIANQMTANGELGTDPSDSKDKGVKCEVDREQNVVSTGKVKVRIAVKPYGYAKYVEAEIGFMKIQS